MEKNCDCCGRLKDTRLGYCFDCAEAESIIAEGLDMFEKGPKENDTPAKKPMDKLRFLIKKGWRKP